MDGQTFYARWEMPVQLVPDEPVLVNAKEGEEKRFVFTPPSDGEYNIYMSLLKDCENEITIYDSLGFSIPVRDASLVKSMDVTNVYRSADLKAGSAYGIEASSALSGPYCLTVTTSEPGLVYENPVITSCEPVQKGIYIEWEPVEGFSDYLVFRCSPKDTEWQYIKNAQGNSFLDTSAASGKRYDYCICPMTNDGRYTFHQFWLSDTSVFSLPVPKLKPVKIDGGGITLSWEACSGADRYCILKKDKYDWSAFTWSDGTSCKIWDDDLKYGKTYQFTVAAVSDDSISKGPFDPVGLSVVFYPEPELRSIKNVASGVKVQWKTVKGVKNYAVYRKLGNGKWKKLGNTQNTGIIDKTAVSGKTYSYTVRCVSGDGKTVLSAYDPKGLSITYFAAPRLTTVKNGKFGVELAWTAVKGATKYRVYYKQAGGKWLILGETDRTSGTDYPDVSNKVFYYKVCCISEYGEILSGAIPTSEGLRYVDAPEITKVNRSSNGSVSIQWKAPAGSTKNYRVFRAVSGGKWVKLADTKSRKYIDKTAKNGKLYSYMVRCISADGKKYTSCYDDYGWGTLVPLKSLKNYKGFAQWMNDGEFKAAYNAAAQYVQRLVRLKRTDQLLSIATLLRQMIDNGEVSYASGVPHYNDPYGYFVSKVVTCAGCTRATGMCLNMLGIPYEHVHENQNCHQWARVKVGKEYWICDAFGMCCEQEIVPYMHNNPMLY